MKWNNHMLLMYSKLVVVAAVVLLVFVSAIAVAVVADEMKAQLEASN